MSRRGKEQGWILQRFVQLGGIETFFPESLPFFLEMGYKYADLKRVAERSKTGSMMRRAFAEIAKHREEMGRRAEEENHFLSARNFYHLAALYYGRARWSIFEEGNKEKLGLHEKLVRCYDKVIALNDYPMEKVEIPFEDGSIFGVLHLPPAAEKVPVVLFCPGLDITKEDFPNVQNNIFVRRGMAVLAIDGPGQGECRIHGVKWRITDIDNYQKAGRAAIDFLVKRPEVDKERIGVFGISQGSYWAPLIAAYDNRVKACVGMMSSYYEQGLDVGQPTFKDNVMYMMGLTESELDAVIPKITVADWESKIRSSLLLLHGQYDELSTENDAEVFLDKAVNAPFRELTTYEAEFHPLGGVSVEAFQKVGDWMRDRLEGKPQSQRVVKNFVPRY